MNSGDDAPISLVNVLYTPKLKANIVSLVHLDDRGCKIMLEKGALTIHDEKGRLVTRVKRNVIISQTQNS